MGEPLFSAFAAKRATDGTNACPGATCSVYNWAPHKDESSLSTRSLLDHIGRNRTIVSTFCSRASIATLPSAVAIISNLLTTMFLELTCIAYLFNSAPDPVKMSRRAGWILPCPPVKSWMSHFVCAFCGEVCTGSSIVLKKRVGPLWKNGTKDRGGCPGRKLWAKIHLTSQVGDVREFPARIGKGSVVRSETYWEGLEELWTVDRTFSRVAVFIDCSDILPGNNVENTKTFFPHSASAPNWPCLHKYSNK